MLRLCTQQRYASGHTLTPIMGLKPKDARCSSSPHTVPAHDAMTCTTTPRSDTHARRLTHIQTRTHACDDTRRGGGNGERRSESTCSPSPHDVEQPPHAPAPKTKADDASGRPTPPPATNRSDCLPRKIAESIRPSPKSDTCAFIRRAFHGAALAGRPEASRRCRTGAAVWRSACSAAHAGFRSMRRASRSLPHDYEARVDVAFAGAPAAIRADRSVRAGASFAWGGIDRIAWISSVFRWPEIRPACTIDTCPRTARLREAQRGSHYREEALLRRGWTHKKAARARSHPSTPTSSAVCATLIAVWERRPMYGRHVLRISRRRLPA